MSRMAFLLLWLAGCSRATSPDVSSTAEALPRSCIPGGECDLRAGENCGAGKLPRFDALSPGQRAELVSLARERTVAVSLTGTDLQLVPSCRLDGKYTEVEGEPGSGRFHATNRVLFLPDEVPAACATATHLVGAFVNKGDALAGILVPLPCPPSTSEERAVGCVGRGMTGSERRARSEKMMEWRDAEQLEARHVLEVYALWPEHRGTIGYRASVGTRRPFDCFVEGQLDFALTSYEWRLRPSFDNQTSAALCTNFPPFLTCFPGLFDPAPGDVTCWNEVHR